MNFKIIALLSILLVTALETKSQTEGFVFFLSTGDSLMMAGELQAAAVEYRKVYQKDPTNGNNLYNLACALALTRQADSAFKYLNLSVEADTTEYALTDPDFISLQNDKRWNKFEDKLISMLSVKLNNPYKDIAYAKQLWRMKARDQAYYDEIKIASKKYGVQSPKVAALWALKKSYNYQNLTQLEVLIKKKGWPKKSEVGGQASEAAFLVIQHSDTKRQKKYLKTIEKLCKEGEAQWQSYALMYDRIQTSEGKPQRFGSQITYNEQTKKYELLPLEDLSKVDQWRKEMNMQPLADYVAQWGITLEPSIK